MNNPENSRRKFLVRGMVSLAALPFAGVMLSKAVALKYVADAKKGVGVKPGSNCANCALFQAATKGCSIFPGFAVAPAGWCSAWAKKA